MSLVISYKIYLMYYVRYDPLKNIIKFTLVIVKINIIWNSKLSNKKLILHSITYYETTNMFGYFMPNASSILY